MSGVAEDVEIPIDCKYPPITLETSKKFSNEFSCCF